MSSYTEYIDDNVYVNVTFNNNNKIVSQGAPFNNVIDETPVLAEYNVTKTLPILSKCSDYYVSVIRFDIPLDTTPVMIMPIVPNQANPDLTPMIIGIRYLGVDYPIPINYISDNTLTAPTQNDPNGQIITPYYFVFTYDNLINVINLSLRQAIINSGAVLLHAGQYPYFFFDPATQLISLVVDNTFTTAGVNKPEIYVNAYLKNYLDSFRYSIVGFNQPNGRDFVFILNGTLFPTPNQGVTYEDNKPPTVPVAEYFQFTEEYNVMNYWTSLRKLIITTNGIPIKNEYVPANNNSNTSGVAVSFPILTDFVPAIELAGQSRAVAYYYPTSQYRLVDLLNDNPLYKIDLKIYWEDRKGNLYPLTISAFQQASIKLGFFKKSLYNSTKH